MNMRATVLYDMILLVTGTMAFVGRNVFILKPEINLLLDAYLGILKY